jgi:RNA polymerase sigma factor (sigma-70 family)
MCYETKIKKVQPRLNGYIKSRVYSNHDAEDIIQDTNRILINKEKEYEESKNFNAWAFAIASFQIKAYLSRSKRSKLVYNSNEPLLDSIHPSTEKAEDTNLSPSEILQNKEDKNQRIKKIKLSKTFLSETEKQVFELSELNYKNKQISKILRITEGSVGAYKSRAIKKIKKTMAL